MTIAPESADLILARHATRNFWLNVLDGSMFMAGLSMVSRYTVLPLFVERLGGGALLQGFIPAIFFVGWLLPGLFIAPMVASVPRRKSIILVATTCERLPFLLLGLLLLFAPDLPAATLLAAFFALYLLYAFSMGVASTAWQDFIARLIPGRRWGVFFGAQQGLGGLLGVVSAGIAALLLATQPFPQSVGMLSLLCFGAMVISFVALASTVEPPQPVAARTPLRTFLRGIGPLLRADPVFRRYLLCRSAIALGFVGHSFLTAALLSRFAVPDAEIGIVTGVMLGTTALGNLVLGWMADRWGHKQVLELATVLGLAAIVLAIVAPGPAWYYGVFGLAGLAQAGYILSGFTLVFSFSQPENRPAYIGVANTALAPAAALGPLLAGALASVTSYEVMLGLLVAIGLVGLVALQRGVHLPARQPAASIGDT